MDRGDAYQSLESMKRQPRITRRLSRSTRIDAYAYASRCESYLDLDDSQRALADCNKAIELEPSLAYAYRVRAIVVLHEKDSTAAVADANEAIKLIPASSNALVSRCRAYLMLGKYPDTLQDCSTAASIEPDNDDAFFYRGEAEIAESN